MKGRIAVGALLTSTLALCIASACGGGRTAVVGLGNSGNRIFEESETSEELAEALAENAATPRISDETLAEIFQAILRKARAGDPESALVVLRVAAQQREAEDS